MRVEIQIPYSVDIQRDGDRFTYTTSDGEDIFEVTIQKYREGDTTVYEWWVNDDDERPVALEGTKYVPKYIKKIEEGSEKEALKKIVLDVYYVLTYGGLQPSVGELGWCPS